MPKPSIRVTAPRHWRAWPGMRLAVFTAITTAAHAQRRAAPKPARTLAEDWRVTLVNEGPT
jgi:hypothetical protein